MSFIIGLYRRFAHLFHELAKFGVIGTLAAIMDLGGAGLLEGSGLLGPLTAKVISTAAAATFSYAGNRLWTFRHRANNGLAREYFLFFVLNGIATLFAILVIGFTEYTLNLHGHLAFNVAQVSGTVAGTAFRYWAYKKWVFLPPELPQVEPHTGLPIRPAAEERPTAAYPAARPSPDGQRPRTGFGPKGNGRLARSRRPRRRRVRVTARATAAAGDPLTRRPSDPLRRAETCCDLVLSVPCPAGPVSRDR